MRIPVFSRAVTIVSAAIAMGTGLVILLGYFVDLAGLLTLRRVFLDWAIILAAAALLIGIANLFQVHMRKLRAGGAGAVYSLVLIVSLTITFGLGVVLGPDHVLPRWIFSHIQVPVETSLMAVLAVTLLYAAARLLMRRLNIFSVIFVLTVVLIMLGTGAFPWGELPVIGDVLRPWISQVPAAAGARGVLMGVSLGIIATGLRILMGADRPYGG